MHAVQIKEMVVLQFIEHVSELHMLGSVPKHDIVDILVKFIVVRGVLSDITPQHDLACFRVLSILLQKVMKTLSCAA